MVVLDTAVLIWWTLDDTKLSPAATRAISKATHLVVSSISIWEIGLASTRGRLDLPASLTDYVEGLERVDMLNIRAVDTATWLENLQLDWDHRDPADRTIVALARIQRAPLITSDARIREFHPETIW